jgi:hypothetical protein
MSDTEARAADDATPNGVAAPREPVVSTGSTDEDGPPDEDGSPDEDGPTDDVDGSSEGDGSTEDGSGNEESREPSWWHRSHPTFAGLMGFFTGVAFVILVPGAYAGILSATVSEKTAQKLFPLVLVALVVPIAMLVPRKTRRFAQMMLLGLVATALVIIATASLVIWVMVQLDK